MKKRNVLLIALVIILAVVMLFVYKAYAPKSNQGQKEITIMVNHLVGEEKSFKIKTDAEYLREALDEINLVSGTESQYGLFVDTVDGETADASKEEWWGYTIDGEFALYGVDEQPVNDGDIYEFTLYVGYDMYN